MSIARPAAELTTNRTDWTCYDAAGPRVRAALNVATEEDQFSLFGLFESDGSSTTREATRPEDFGNRLPADDVQVVESGGVITEITVALRKLLANGLSCRLAIRKGKP